MADGYRCKHCGWQEADHYYPDSLVSEEDATKRRSGYRITLEDCDGFELSKKNQKEWEKLNTLTESEIVSMEIEARSKAAWGLYGEIMRADRFKQDIERFDEKIRKADSGKGKREAEREKEQFLSSCRSANTLRVGFY